MTLHRRATLAASRVVTRAGREPVQTLQLGPTSPASQTKPWHDQFHWNLEHRQIPHAPFYPVVDTADTPTTAITAPPPTPLGFQPDDAKALPIAGLFPAIAQAIAFPAAELGHTLA
jgi:hypothetical protein